MDRIKDMESWLGHGNVVFIPYSVYNPLGSFDGISMHKTLVIRGIILSNHNGKTEIIQLEKYISPYMKAKPLIQKEIEGFAKRILEEACDKYALHGEI